jgi:hypothetical protein
MSDNSETSAPVSPPEAQHQRWLKYGANVAFTVLIVLMLTGLVIWAAQGSLPMTRSLRGRADLTSDSSNQLKPQTISLIKDLPGKVTLVSLYPRLKREETAAMGDTYQRVLDILEEYRRNGRNIDVQAIDPIAEPGKLDAWLGELKRRYGSNIGKYEQWLNEFPRQLEEIRKLAEPETASLRSLIEELRKLDLQGMTDEQIEQLNTTVSQIANTVSGMPAKLELMNSLVREELNRKIPNYEGAADVLRSGLTELSGRITRLTTRLNSLKEDKTAPEAVKKYASEAGPRYAAMKKLADDILAAGTEEKLGKIKLDDVRRKLIPADEAEPPAPAIAVMGDTDVKVIDDQSLWKSGQSTGLTGRAQDRPKLRFAGEQQLTSAILALSQEKKQKVAFIRAGGPPRTIGFMTEAPFSAIAERLRGYNFDVLEKDITGMAAMSQQMPGMDASDEEIKDAIWVVLSERSDPRMGMMGQPGALGAKLKEHLDNGGSALCLIELQGEDLELALKDWGIAVKPSVLIVHEKIEAGDADSSDFIEQARRQPYIFIVNQFGAHPVTAPLASLDAALVPLVQVSKASPVPPDVTVTEVLPVPTNPRAWGETDLSPILSRDPRGVSTPTFDPATDVAGPLFAGAIAQRKDKGRLVVLGCQNFIANTLLEFTDPKLEKSKVRVSRFPGNGELFTNSIFWLAGNEKMIALSPAALDTARIRPIPTGALNFIRVGLVWIGLPLLAIGAGIFAWFVRRD